MLRFLRREFGFAFGNVFLLLIVWAVTDFVYVLPDTYYSLYVEALGASPFILGTVLSAAWLVMALLQLAGGYWADKEGRKTLIVAMSFGKALIFLIFAAAPSWEFILLGEILVSIAVISQPALMAIMADSLPPERRGLGYSLSLVVGATSILSPIVAGFLYSRYGLLIGMRMTYVIVSLVWFVSGLIFLRLKETVKVGQGWLSLKEVFKQYPRACKECLTVWRHVPKPMVMLLVVFTPITFFVRMCMPYYSLYAIHELKIDGFQWAMLQTYYLIIFYVSLLPVGKLVDVFGRKKPLVLSSVFFALGLTLFLFGDIPRLFAFYTFSALGNTLIFTAYPSLQADLTPKEYRGKIMGLSNFIDCFIGSAALLLGGFLYESINPMMPFILQLVFMIATVAATLALVTEPKARQD